MFDVITIGTATRDAFLKSEAFKVVSTPEFVSGWGLCLPAGGKIDLEDVVFATGGGATNAATTFSRQGYHAAAVCRIGDDVSGREVLKDLQIEHISTGFVVQDENSKTAYSVLILSPSGERTVLTYRGASEHFEVADVNPRTLMAKWFYVAGSVPVNILNAVLDKAGETGAKVAMNPSQSQIKLGLSGLGEVFRKLNVVIMNREEGSRLTGVDYKREEKIFNVLDEYVKGIVILTDGPKGVLVSDGQKIYQAGIFKNKNVVDRTGAGDAFGSGFVAGLMPSNNVKSAIRLASANATSVVEKIGAKAGILTADQFEKDPRWQDLKIEVKDII
ncbi:MAG: carbohydrate kinase family protein [Candidatus Sungbacteria bacterium]|uniref:Carbohydrate kinase family protein n=1 Tax=Candidatus Sungiibacteriota bacterium TaxID=2750080 RepID=A0A932DSE9_9BACT|nr:carbohydrate kinase family protein [Candidatus Sungbacteria bacterium]MBI2465975.1 carbohydrate kinase family protein [Candidatus Sungbacteria bacterium]